MRFSTLPTPIGELVLTADLDGALTRLHLPNHPPDTTGWERDDALLEPARRQLAEYFAGERTEFDLPLRPFGAPFQLRVWEALLNIPYGETASYGAIAREIGHPTAFRAVGAANGQNPIAIIVPGPRVLGSNASPPRYGRRLAAQRALLDLEAGRAALV